MAQNPNQGTGGRRVEKATGGGGIEKKGGYEAGPKPLKGVPPVPAGLRQPRTTTSKAQKSTPKPQS
ncbi:MAG: hypothetical protein JO236_02435 [Mycobacterium sp.]|uniref:hypothetical protein n=1 Tax=Mycobacterium sp. TaxID=1785 RepID=UPI001EBDDD91|nr:hypothetical protein [Mycobacterium sp.]MBW0016396.1 hypothetical protein [Mycobacterium sp.]